MLSPLLNDRRTNLWDCGLSLAFDRIGLRQLGTYGFVAAAVASVRVVAERALRGRERGGMVVVLELGGKL